MTAQLEALHQLLSHLYVRALEIARDRLHYDRLPPVQKERLHLLHGSLIIPELSFVVLIGVSVSSKSTFR